MVVIRGQGLTPALSFASEEFLASRPPGGRWPCPPGRDWVMFKVPSDPNGSMIPWPSQLPRARVGFSFTWNHSPRSGQPRQSSGVCEGPGAQQWLSLGEEFSPHLKGGPLSENQTTFRSRFSRGEWHCSRFSVYFNVFFPSEMEKLTFVNISTPII